MLPDITKDPNGEPRLSVIRKAQILKNNLFGVDIDPQAVEITMMSLYLKALEGERSQLPPKQHLLPELKNNIICGNSLIGPDIYSQGTLFGDDERDRINAFDWNSEVAGFGRIMKEGGFDCVIANPPYVRMEEFKETKAYLKSQYASHDERSDLYAYFIERAHLVLKEGGRFGMIVSNKFFRANYGKPLRAFLNSAAKLERVVDLAGLPVFQGATVRTAVLITSRSTGRSTPILYTPPAPLEVFTRVESGAVPLETITLTESYAVPNSALTDDDWSFAKPEVRTLLKRLLKGCIKLAHYCEGKICRGVVSGLTEAFVISAAERRAILKRNARAGEIIKPFLGGRDIRRYAIEGKEQFLIYAYHGIEIDCYPAALDHLKSYKSKLLQRATEQNWYELQQPQLNFAKYMDGPKIIFPDIAISPRFSLDELGHYGSNTTYFIPLRDLYLLGILNSRLGLFYFSQVCAGLEGSNETYLRFFGQYLEGFPIRAIDSSDSADVGRRDKMVTLVERMLELNKKKYSGKLAPSELDRLEREIAATDAQIDDLVYELYEITDEERTIIERV